VVGILDRKDNLMDVRDEPQLIAEVNRLANPAKMQVVCDDLEAIEGYCQSVVKIAKANAVIGIDDQVQYPPEPGLRPTIERIIRLIDEVCEHRDKLRTLLNPLDTSLPHSKTERYAKAIGDAAEGYGEAIRRVSRSLDNAVARIGNQHSRPTLEDVAHSDDFRSLRWFGTEYSFTANQSRVVAMLYENWERGTPDVGIETLLSGIDHEAPPDRLDAVFRESNAWNEIIVIGSTKGTRRLVEPEKNLANVKCST
jgi:hypothetical protein